MKIIKKNYGLLFIFLISLFPLFNLLTPGLPITHDGLDHVARISSFYANLSEGIVIPRWAGNLNWGYGHLILMFLYPLPSYVASFFHFIDFSLVSSLKITFAIFYSLSGIFMYLWLRKFMGNMPAVLGAILYLFAPYRFIDIYVRGAIGEHAAFTFMPLVLLAIFGLYNRKQTYKIKYLYLYFLFIALSFAFLILSHNAISLLFTPFIIFYTFYLFYESRSKKILLLSISSLIYGLLISFFFWFPAFIEGKYTLRDIVTTSEYLNRFIEIPQLLYGNWNYGGTGEFTTQLGIIQILLVITAIIFLFKFIRSKDNHRYLLLGTLIILFGSIFLMLGESKLIWNYLTILQKLQFPWRFLAITTFCTALVGAIFIDKIKIKKKNILIIIIIFATIIPTINYWRANEYKLFSDSLFNKEYPSTTDTGESSPIWSVRSIDEFPKNNIELLSGNANIIELHRKSTKHEYLIDVKKRSRIRENTLFFPGWKIYDNNSLISDVEFQDPKNRGVMTFYLDEGLHVILLQFEETKIRKASNLISIISILFLFLLFILFLLFPTIKYKKYK